MMQSLAAAVSGLQGEQTAMNVIAENIANVNTTGFKGSDVNFATLLSQQLSSGSAPTKSSGGTDPMEIGLGTSVGSITTNMSEGPLQETSNPLDIAIEGNGFLTLSGSQGVVYSRDGALGLDANGNLVQASSGAIVEGWTPAGGPTTNLTWTESSTTPAPTSTTPGPLNIPGTYTPSGGSAEQLSGVAISPDGIVVATYEGSGGASTQVVVGQIALAVFPNPSGLVAVGQNAYTPGPNALASGGTGVPFAQPGSNGAGALAVGALEQSNVDISTELTNMIVAERTYEVDAKVITSSDNMLQALIQIQ